MPSRLFKRRSSSVIFHKVSTEIVYRCFLIAYPKSKQKMTTTFKTFIDQIIAKWFVPVRDKRKPSRSFALLKDETHSDRRLSQRTLLEYMENVPEEQESSPLQRRRTRRQSCKIENSPVVTQFLSNNQCTVTNKLRLNLSLTQQEGHELLYASIPEKINSARSCPPQKSNRRPQTYRDVLEDSEKRRQVNKSFPLSC